MIGHQHLSLQIVKNVSMRPGATYTFDDSRSTIGNSSLSSFLSALTEDKEVTSFEIVADNARPSQDSLNNLTFLPEPETKCRWRNLTRTDSDDDIMGRRRGKPRDGRGRRSTATFSSLPRRGVSSDPNLLLMPRRKLSPDRMSRNTSLDKSSSHGSSRFQKTKMVAASDTNLLRMPQRKPSPQKAGGRMGLMSSMNSKVNATWGADPGSFKSPNQKIKKNVFLDLVAPDLSRLESSSVVSVDKPIVPPERRSSGPDLSADIEEASVESMEEAALVSWGGETESTQSSSSPTLPKLVSSNASLMKQDLVGRPSGKLSKKKGLDKMGSGLQSKAKLYGLY